MLLFGLLVAHVSAERLPVRTYTTADGLGTSAVSDILYDSHGFLWFATRDGISRFDGFSFKNYKLGPEAVGGSISEIIERRNGDYLVVKQQNGIYRFNEKTAISESTGDESLTINAELVFNRSSSRLFEDRDGDLWTIAGGRLARILEIDGKFVSKDPLAITIPGRPDVSIFHYLEDEARTFWLTTNLGLLRITKDGRVISLYTTPPSTAMRTYLLYLFADRDGNIWIDSQDGIYVFRPGMPAVPESPTSMPLVENISKRLPMKPGEIVKFAVPNSLRGNDTPSFKQSVDGRIWLASDIGLLLFDRDQFRLYNRENGVGEFLSDITEDAEGNLWVASQSGVYKIVLNGLTTYTRAEGLGRTDIAAVYQNKDGDIFTSAGDWFVSRFDGDRFVSVRPDLGGNHGPGLWTSNLAFLDSAGSWWFLTEEKLYRYDGIKEFQDLSRRKPSAIFASGDEFNNGAFYKLFEDSRNDVWTSMRSATPENVGLNLWHRDENKFQKFGQAENFPARMAPSSFCEDRQGNLWIGFYRGGLARFRDGKFTVFSNEDGVPQSFVTAIFLDHAGKIHFATADSGAYTIEDTSAEKPAFKRIAGISSDNARAITEDNFGRLYVGTVRGIDRISADGNEVLHLSTADGLADDFVTVAFRDQSGILWFGTRNGLSRLNPVPDAPAVEPPILIAGLRIAGEKQAVSELGTKNIGRLDLKSTQNNLQIDFFSVGFASPERVGYQVKLEGADEDWSEPSADRTVNYSNLGAGDYSFLVRAVNSQGLASKNPATVVFRIAPPIWKTWWFSGLAALIVLATIYFFLNQRFKRFLDLEKMRTRIATDLHDDLGASLSRISILSEIVKLKNGTSHPESAGHLSQIASEARGLIDSMSDIVWAINPRHDSIEVVVDRVCSFAADTLGTQGVHWTVESPPEMNRLHLSAEQKRNLYLIFKEAINNSVRHSECQNASLAIRLEGTTLIAEFSDDGRGFDETTANGNKLGGRGMENIRSRAAEIGAKISVETGIDAGTKIILKMPVKSSRPNMRFPFSRPR